MKTISCEKIEGKLKVFKGQSVTSVIEKKHWLKYMTRTKCRKTFGMPVTPLTS